MKKAMQKWLSKALLQLPAEAAHAITLFLLAHGAAALSKRKQACSTMLTQNLWGLEFKNPLGMAAGFDKDAKVYGGLLDLGLGSVEVGTVTVRSQMGNSGKRLFRLNSDAAVINRLGLPSLGMEKVVSRLQNNSRHVLGVNIGYNKDSSDISQDYRQLAKVFGVYADYLTINVSCPNVMGGENLQAPDFLPLILRGVREGLSEIEESPPVWLKLSPDVSHDELRYICDCAVEHGVSALLISNTTVGRPVGLVGVNKNQQGGLSGKPLFGLATECLARAYCHCGGDICLVGVGGIASVDDAYVKIKAGASLLQIYTGLIYQGVVLIGDILDGLPLLLSADGYGHVGEAVGVEAENYK